MADGAVLLVDDDAPIRRMLERTLGAEGYAVSAVADGGAALAQVERSVPDVIVLDVAMPGLDGLAVTRRLRAKGLTVPILLLTARDAIEERVAGLDAGADDYLVKPFDVDELKARVRALLRRTGDGADPDALAFEELRLDSARHGVSVNDDFVELTRTEYQLLELLLLNPRRVLPHSVIYDRVWGYDFGPASNALRVYVGYQRRKLEDAGARPLIHTVRGVGYALREP